MATEEATVKLTLDSGNYVTAMKKVGDASKRSADKSTQAFKTVGVGVDKVKKGMTALGGKMTTVIGLAATFGGAFVLGTAIKGVISLKTEMISLQNELERATGSQIDINKLQGEFEAVALRNARSTKEVAAAFREIRNTTQDLEFAKKTFELATIGANATGKSVEQVGKILSQLNKRFNITAEEAPAAFQSVIEFADKGAFSLEEFGGIADVLGPSLKLAGLTGSAGLRVLLGTFQDVGNQLGNVQGKMTGVQNLMVKLIDPNQLKRLAKISGVSLTDLVDEEDALGKIRTIVAKGQKGLDSLRAVFVSGKERAVLEQFLKPFEDARKQAKEAGVAGVALTAAGLEAFDAQIAGFGKSTGTFAKLQEQAARAVASPERKLALALEKVTQSFQDPKFIGAIESLADKLPIMAEGVADMVKFIIDNPLTSAGLAIGAKTATSFGGGAIRNALSGGGGAGKAAGAEFAKSGTAAGKGASASFVKGARFGPMGKAFGAAAAGIIAFEMTTSLLDFFDELEAREKAKKGGAVAINVGEQATRAGASRVQKELALKKVQAGISAGEKASKTGFFASITESIEEFGQLLAGRQKDDRLFQSESEVVGQQTSRLKELAAKLEAELAEGTGKGKPEPVAQAAVAAAEVDKGPKKVTISDSATLTEQLARGIASKTLRVEVINMPPSGPGGGGNNSRGPGIPPAPTAGGGTGAV